MIRFLDNRELSSLRNNFSKLIALKILSKDKNVDKFYNNELNFYNAIRTYLHLVNASCFNKVDISIEEANEKMLMYLDKYDKELCRIVKKCEKFCIQVDEEEDENIYDNIYDDFQQLSENIIDILNFNIYDFANIEETSIYSLIYDYHDDEIFDDYKRELYFDIRKEILEFAGGYCEAAYWYPDSMRDAPIEEKLPSEDSLFELFQCECTILAIAFNNPYITKELYFATSFNRSIGTRGSGVGILSEMFFNDNNNNLFVTITSELTFNADYSIFIICAILSYKLRKGYLSFGKASSRVC